MIAIADALAHHHDDKLVVLVTNYYKVNIW